MCGVYVFFQPSFGSACGKYSWTCLTVCLKWWAISLHSTPVHVILTCAWTCGHALHPKKYGKWSIYIYIIFNIFQHFSTSNHRRFCEFNVSRPPQRLLQPNMTLRWVLFATLLSVGLPGGFWTFLSWWVTNQEPMASRFRHTWHGGISESWSGSYSFCFEFLWSTNRETTKQY